MLESSDVYSGLGRYRRDHRRDWTVPRVTADPVLRLRQICLLARDLEWTSSVLSTAFDAPVVFRDPRMAAGGSLTNTHIRLGDSFLETVSPSALAWERSTTQTRLLERHGDCG